MTIEQALRRIDLEYLADIGCSVEQMLRIVEKIMAEDE